MKAKQILIYTKYTKYKYCHKNQHKTLIISNLFFLFEKYGFSTFYKCLDWRKCIFCILVCFVFWNVISNAFIGFGDVYCIYEYILKIFSNLFEQRPEVWTNFARTVCFVIISPPSSSPASVKVPFQWKRYGKIFSHIFLWFLEKQKWRNCTKIITSLKHPDRILYRISIWGLCPWVCHGWTTLMFRFSFSPVLE